MYSSRSRRRQIALHNAHMTHAVHRMGCSTLLVEFWKHCPSSEDATSRAQRARDPSICRLYRYRSHQRQSSMSDRIQGS